MPFNFTVKVVYALPEKQYLQSVTVARGATIGDAIRLSGILELRKEIDLFKNKVGIYGQSAKLEDVVSNGDRIEIYRPLIADPRILRRNRTKR